MRLYGIYKAYDMRQFSAVYKKTKDWYVGWVEEISGVNVQGKTLEEAKENLRESLALVIAANRLLAKRDAGRGKVVRETVRMK